MLTRNREAENTADGLKPFTRRSARMQNKVVADEFVLPNRGEKNIFDICLEKQEAEKKAAIKLAKRNERRRLRRKESAEAAKRGQDQTNPQPELVTTGAVVDIPRTEADTLECAPLTRSDGIDKLALELKIAVEKDVGLSPLRSTFDIEGSGPLNQKSLESMADDPTGNLIPVWAHFLR